MTDREQTFQELDKWITTNGGWATTEEALQAWANGQLSYEAAYMACEDQMPYGVITGDDQLPEEWMADEASRLGVEFPE